MKCVRTEYDWCLRVEVIGSCSFHFDRNGCVIILVYLSTPVDSDKSERTVIEKHEFAIVLRL
jgi:hypothetical protein